MSAREYRILGGSLLVWAVLPLPFVYVVMPPFWIIALAAGLVLIVRPQTSLSFPRWSLNLIGVLILAVVLAVGGLRVGPLRPLGHLLLLLTTVLVLLVRDRRTFFSALLPIALLWVVGVTSSTHITVVVYFIASCGIWWWTGMTLHLAGLDGAPSGIRFVKIRHAVTAALFSVLIAGPIFLVLPRLRSPWIAGRGGVSSVTGFSSQVDLSGVGPIQTSHEVALEVRSRTRESLGAGWMRLRGTAFERVTLDSWSHRRADRVPLTQDGVAWPFGEIGRLDDLVEIEIDLLRPRRYLFLPEGTVALRSPVPVRLDPTGGVVLTRRVRGPLNYTVWVTTGRPPLRVDRPRPLQHHFPTHQEVRRMARDITAGRESDLERAKAVASYLQENYRYSMDGMSRIGPDPMAWFLLNRREGHCEYFAGAMVVLLTEVGVTARVVGGYSGGSLMDNDRTAIVHQANAHTWVEVWDPVTGSWVTFDPTPASDVPPLIRPTHVQRIRWTWEKVQALWDRYVLTFGLGEQVQLVTAIVEGSEALAKRIRIEHLVWLAGILGVGAAVRWTFVARRRREGAAARRSRSRAAETVHRLAKRLQRAGVEVPEGATMRWIANAARQRWPAAAAPISDLVWWAEMELYAEAGTPPADILHRLWSRARQGIQGRAGRQHDSQVASRG